MQMGLSCLGLVAVFATMLPTANADADAESVTPTTKVLQLMSDLQQTIVKQGATAQKLYEEAAELCEDQSKDLQFSIKTADADVSELTATIDKETAKIGALEAKVDELTSSMADSETSLKELNKVRTKEAADFGDEEKELTGIVGMLTRAIGILERELSKGGAAMLQFKNADSVSKALNVLVDAFAFRSADAATLTALVQSAQKNSEAQQSDEEDEDEGVGAPAGAVYKDQSGSIVTTMEELLEKAEGQLADARTAETQAQHNYDMAKQSIEDESKYGKKDFEKVQKGLSASKGTKSTAEGDLARTSRQLKTDIATLDDLHQACMSKAQDYEASVKSRKAEMNAITDAKKLVAESTGAADEQTYGSDASFLQVARSGSQVAAPAHVVRLVRDLAMKQHSRSLMQLSQRMASAFSRGGADPFGKVTGLIKDMIAKLNDQAETEAAHKAYCDKEMAETKVKEADKKAEIESLSTKLDQMSSHVMKLKAQVAVLQKSLAEIASAQAEMNTIRQKEHAAFVQVKSDLQQGIAGVQSAMSVLKEYYGKADDADHAAATGGGAGIIGLLEVIESDFAQGLAECEANEQSAQASFETETKDNEVETASKSQDVKFKTQEATGLEKAIADATADRSGTQAELEAVMEYWASLVKQCVAKPESYEQRKGRREAELAGLKEALASLEGQSFLQQSSKRKLRTSSRQHILATH